MTTYAKTTDVPAERTQEHIKAMLRHYGCQGLGIMERGREAIVFFELDGGLTVKLKVALPEPKDFESYDTRQGVRTRTPCAADRACEQETRSRWRGLMLVIQAKLVAVEAGISTIEREFMADVVTKDGRCVHELLLPQLHRMASTGEMPRLLGLPPPPKAENNGKRSGKAEIVVE